MRKVTLFAGLTALFFLFTPATRGQDADEVERLRKDNELLKKENELLKKEIELLKREAQARPGAAKDPETEGKQPRTKAMMRDATGHVQVEVELVKCVRGADPTLVTFTFTARWIEGRSRGEAVSLGSFPGLRLFTADGKRIDGRMTFHPPRALIKLTKGETTKFQAGFLGMDPDIKEIGEVRMHFPFSPQTDDLEFYHIKIETEK